MDTVLVLSCISFVLTIVALHLLGKPDRRTFPVFIVSILVQGIIFYIVQNWFLLAQMGVIMIYNVKNWINWKKEGVG